MSESIQVRDEFDADGETSLIEFLNLSGRERGRVLPGIFMSREGERVFDVELQLIDPEPSERRNEFQEFGLSWHPVARDVEHEAAHG